MELFWRCKKKKKFSLVLDVESQFNVIKVSSHRSNKTQGQETICPDNKHIMKMCIPFCVTVYVSLFG